MSSPTRGSRVATSERCSASSARSRDRRVGRASRSPSSRSVFSSSGPIPRSLLASRSSASRACFRVARSTSIPGSSIWARRFTILVCRSWRCSTSSNGSTRSLGHREPLRRSLRSAHLGVVRRGWDDGSRRRASCDRDQPALREAAIAVVAGVFRQAIDAAAGDAVAAARASPHPATAPAHRKAKAKAKARSRVPPAPWRRKGPSVS